MFVFEEVRQKTKIRARWYYSPLSVSVVFFLPLLDISVILPNRAWCLKIWIQLASLSPIPTRVRASRYFARDAFSQMNIMTLLKLFTPWGRCGLCVSWASRNKQGLWANGPHFRFSAPWCMYTNFDIWSQLAQEPLSCRITSQQTKQGPPSFSICPQPCVFKLRLFVLYSIGCHRNVMKMFTVPQPPFLQALS